MYGKPIVTFDRNLQKYTYGKPIEKPTESDRRRQIGSTNFFTNGEKLRDMLANLYRGSLLMTFPSSLSEGRGT